MTEELQTKLSTAEAAAKLASDELNALTKERTEIEEAFNGRTFRIQRHVAGYCPASGVTFEECLSIAHLYGACATDNFILN